MNSKSFRAPLIAAALLVGSAGFALAQNAVAGDPGGVGMAGGSVGNSSMRAGATATGMVTGIDARMGAGVGTGVSDRTGATGEPDRREHAQLTRHDGPPSARR